jgi:RNA polymerase sigma factor (sigma-70 family)
VNDQTDSQLLRTYAEHRSEPAFAELVRRHVDLVYSAALRMVCDSHLAEDVTQGVFVALAKNAAQLLDHPVLSGWLHRTAQNIAAQSVRTDVRRRAREQEAAAMNELLSAESDAPWERIAPHLDAALGELSEPDRDALLLRYFERKSAHEMAQTLGISDEAAQKRVSRAVERLREFFEKRGITAGAGGLAVVISANAVEAAPVGLAAAISTAAALAGTTIASTTTATAIKTIAMTTLQKTVVAAALAATVGAGIYEGHQASISQSRVQTLQQQQAPLAEQIQQFQQERDNAARQIAALRADNERLNSNTAELLRLRGEVNLLKHNQTTAGTSANPAPSQNEPSPGKETLSDEFGLELGNAVVRGDAAAMGRILDLVKTEYASFNTNSARLDDTQRGELARKTFAPVRAAFGVIGEAAGTGNQFAMDALAGGLQIPELTGLAMQSLGSLAGSGNENALDVLTHPEKYGALLSSSIPPLQPAADKGIQKAIDALATVAMDGTKQPLWFMTANSLAKAAEAGNPVAIDALINIASSTNSSVQDAAVQGLKGAAANQNAKAVEALRLIGTPKRAP